MNEDMIEQVGENVPILTVAIGAGKALFQTMDFIRGVKDSSVVSAYFKWDGSRIEGSNKIEIERYPGKEGDKV